jgi:serine/threonine protein phosphatase 1
MASGARSFLQRFLGGPRPAQDVAAPPRAPAGTTTYVVGDIHGRADMLASLLRKIAADAAEDEVQGVDAGQRELILLGDYVDRGPDSRGVIDTILSIQNDTDFWTVTALKGNHEFAFLTFLNDATYWPVWADYGARETLLSYGVNPPIKVSDAEEWTRAHAEINAAVPPEHRAFLEGLELVALRGDYLCTHAGVRPDIPIEDQVEQDLLWIREDFLRNTRRLEKVIVHGHTPAAEAFLGEHRIGLDTGAYATSVLTAVKLRGAEQTLIQARGKD